MTRSWNYWHRHGKKPSEPDARVDNPSFRAEFSLNEPITDTCSAFRVYSVILSNGIVSVYAERILFTPTIRVPLRAGPRPVHRAGSA